MENLGPCIGILVAFAFLAFGAYACYKSSRTKHRVLAQSSLDGTADLSLLHPMMQVQMGDMLDKKLRDVSIGVGPGMYGSGREVIFR